MTRGHAGYTTILRIEATVFYDAISERTEILLLDFFTEQTVDGYKHQNIILFIV
jgi:hypothetical protein